MEEKNNQNNLAGSGTDVAQDNITIEEETDNSADAIKKLREKLKACGAEKSEYLTGWQRAKADLINARREMEDEKKKIIQFSEKMLIADFLEVADGFDRLFSNKTMWENLDKNWRMGVENLYLQFMNILKTRGVEVIKSVGEKFEPKEHESIGEIDIDSQEKDGIVIEEMREGYRMRGAVIRPSLVKVGKFK